MNLPLIFNEINMAANARGFPLNKSNILNVLKNNHDEFSECQSASPIQFANLRMFSHHFVELLEK
jgi:hypothetical protein